jgi:hypothetical protein
MANFDLDKFNQLINKANESISCDETCMQNKKKEELGQKYSEAQANLVSAPEKLYSAKKEYIVFTEGQGKYNEYIDNELQQKANEIANNFTTKFNDNVNLVDTHIANYNGLLINFNNVVDLYKKYKTENGELEKKLKSLSSDILTNDRKTFYEDEGLENLRKYYYFFLFIYFFIVFIFFLSIFLVKTNLTLYSRIGILVLLVAYPFVSIWLYNAVKQLFTYAGKYVPKNVYTSL